jgi:ankyrin repeat protein
MSDSLNLEQLRKEAKTLLKKCRAGDHETIQRMRHQLTRLRALNHQELALQVKLGDVQHAVARERGYRNWAELKRGGAPIAGFLAAVRGGLLKAALDLLQRYPNLVAESIHVASATGDTDAVRQHLETHRDSFAARDEDGWVPLLYASASPFHRLGLRYAFGIHACASLLLDHGADPSAYSLPDPSDPDSRIPAVVRALMNNNRMLLLLLLQRGATVDLPRAMENRMGLTDPLDNPLGKAYVDLLKDTDFRDELGRRLAPVMAGRKHMPKPPSQMSIKELLDLQRNEHAAFADFNMISWQLALESGIDPNGQSETGGEAPLHRLAMRGGESSTTLAELFLTGGADPDLATWDGRTPYAIAVRMGNTSMANLLVHFRARSDTASPADQLLGACRRGDADTAWDVVRSHPALMKSLGPEGRELLIDAVKKNQLPVVKLMAELGFDLHVAAEGGATPLHVAAWHGHVRIVQLLLEFDAPVNSRDPVYRTSPLAWAAHGSATSKNWRDGDDADFRAVVEALLDAGADYEPARNQWGIGPEEVASFAVADLLKARGFCKPLQGGDA